jgi:hypothetical protein
MKLNSVAIVILVIRHNQQLNAIQRKRKTNSKTLEYSSFRLLRFCTSTRRAPSGNAARESTNEPEKASEHMADEHSPPTSTTCQPRYSGGLRIKKSSDAEAEETEISSWMTCGIYLARAKRRADMFAWGSAPSSKADAHRGAFRDRECRPAG